MTTESESGTVTHDEAERLMRCLGLPHASEPLLRYISQNRERDAKLEAAERTIAEFPDSIDAELASRVSALEAQRDALLAALVKQREALLEFAGRLVRDGHGFWAIDARGIAADLDAAIKGAGVKP
jgi:hypothetical protein